MKDLYFYPEAVPDRWRGITVSGVIDNGIEVVQVPDESAEFFSVYTYMTNEKNLLSCVADVPDRKSADDLKDLIVAAVLKKGPYKLDEQPKTKRNQGHS